MCSQLDLWKLCLFTAVLDHNTISVAFNSMTSVEGKKQFALESGLTDMDKLKVSCPLQERMVR